ncbi:MAG: ribonuclease PH, partial [Planctomycetales bacterium]
MSKAKRHDGRKVDEPRPIKIRRNFIGAAPGCVLIQSGKTSVLCAASVEEKTPRWMDDDGRGWVTAEYNMTPSSTHPRKSRERGGKISGRTTEIQRLIGRSLRAVVDLEALGPRTITVDCDVMYADGGTRTASVTGAFVALVDAVRSIRDLPDPKRSPLRQSVAAVSVGIVDGRPLLDLDYVEDFA